MSGTFLADQDLTPILYRIEVVLVFSPNGGRCGMLWMSDVYFMHFN